MEDVVKRGLSAHLERVAARRAGGAVRLGWKVAFNAASAQRRLGLDGALIAALDRSTVLEASGSYRPVGAVPVVGEAEVAVVLDRRVDPTADPASARACVGAWGPAIELVQLDRPLDELELILSEGVFHRAVVFGERVRTPGAPLAGLAARVLVDGVPLCDVDAGAATGEVGEVLLRAARLLAPFGESLTEGDAVILGSMNPMQAVAGGQRFTLELGGFAPLSVDVG